jgi:hypothetical protein
VVAGAHDVSPASFWYYFRPFNAACKPSAADVVQLTATCAHSPENTRGKYPEYHRVWEDNELTVLALFGRNIDGATSNRDAGIAAYNAFVSAVSRQLASYPRTTSPQRLPSKPGVRYPDVGFVASLPGQRKVRVNALLVENMQSSNPVFIARYAALSKQADVIVYNGHAGLGANVAALADMGEFHPAKYLLMFINGCDTFAYLNHELTRRRALVNPEDPHGTRYMDVMTNAMPAYFHMLPSGTMAVLKALMQPSAPKTFEQIFGGIDPKQVVIVTGEEDNVYVPGVR